MYQGVDHSRHAPKGYGEIVDEGESCVVRWVGDAPPWMEYPAAVAELGSTVAPASLSVDLLAAVARESGGPSILHVAVEQSGAIPGLRRARPDAAIVLDLTDESLVHDVHQYLRRAAAADLTLVASRAALRELRRRRPALTARTALLPRPVDIDRFVPRRALDPGRRLRLDDLRSRYALRERVLLCPTRLGPAGGIDLAIHCVELVRAQGHDVSLVVLADGGDPRERMRSRAALGRIGAVVLDHVDSPELPLWYAAADAVCLPARQARASMPARLAAAAGVPTLASEVEPYLDVVEDAVTGHLLPVEDVAALTRAVEHIFSDDVHARRLGASARELAEREYSPSCAARRLLALWQQSARQAQSVNALRPART